MTHEEINIAIAKACGWELTPNEWWYKAGEYLPFAPDYLNDLNAMHEAEKSLDDDLDLDYSESLESVTGTRWGANNAYDMSKYRSATASQRAEAFLRTLNLWIP